MPGHGVGLEVHRIEINDKKKSKMGIGSHQVYNGKMVRRFCWKFTQGSITVLHPPNLNDHPTTKGTNEGPPPRILSPKKKFFGFVERTSGSEGPGMEV